MVLRMVRIVRFGLVNSLFMQFVRFEDKNEGTHNLHIQSVISEKKKNPNKIWNSLENSHIFLNVTIYNHRQQNKQTGNLAGWYTHTYTNAQY